MGNILSDIIKRSLYLLSSLTLLLVYHASSPAQIYPPPALPDTSNLGRYTSRTMYLLNQSGPGKNNEVRILVYGQSISEQEWWLKVKDIVGRRFPYAHLIMENKAIGGFSTQYLHKTVEMDVGSFYPDLVLLHIYGNNADYEKVLATIRSRTTAEVAIMTDHFIGDNRWSDTMSYSLLPALADKYKCDLINIRDPWKKYLKENNLEPAVLLKDGVHLNDYGNWLMAELVKPLFCFKSAFPDDPFKLLTTVDIGDGISFPSDTLIIPITGNRVDIVYDPVIFEPGDSAWIFLDEIAPSSFQGCYFMTRPYNTKGEAWPWKLPAMITVDHMKPWVKEEWSCVFTKADPPYMDFRFAISGSVTGKDGKGRASRDFVSRSGRVIIKRGDAEKGGDWHLNRSYSVLKTIVNQGDTVKWKTYPIGIDVLTSSSARNLSRDNSVILFQGVPNSLHTLKITGTGKQLSAFSMIKVYRPFWNR